MNFTLDNLTTIDCMIIAALSCCVTPDSSGTCCYSVVLSNVSTCCYSVVLSNVSNAVLSEVLRSGLEMNGYYKIAKGGIINPAQ